MRLLEVLLVKKMTKLPRERDAVTSLPAADSRLAEMGLDRVLSARKSDANQEFEDSPSQSKAAILVLIALTAIAFLSLQTER